MDIDSIDLYLEKLKNGTYDNHMQDADLADFLEVVKLHDEEKFFAYINLLKLEQRAQILMELPVPFMIDYILATDGTALAEIIEELDSDDATNLFGIIVKNDKDKSDKIFSLLAKEIQDTIIHLMSYTEKEAGSLMQTELFSVPSYKSMAQAIELLAQLKQEGIGMVQHLFVTDERGKFIKSIPIDDLLIEEREQPLAQIIEKFPKSCSLQAHDHIDNVIDSFTKYNLTTLAVLDHKGYLLGRITHDDVVDLMHQQATQQLYNLNKLHENEEIHESFIKSSKTRSIWLGVNLVNAIIASLVIGIFEEILSTIVALAILMPIVANMAGTASVQTMTVIIRQMALGNINLEALRPIFIKELNIALANGILFGFVSVAAAQVWFGNWFVSMAIGLSMLVSFVLAGFLGTTVPIVLKKMNFDPAIASSVIVITGVDIIGFFSFLWFAEMIAL
ncbi:MAG: magnesium transporter [Campylobacterales bacterium]|nr:magnesium transporter [Campylobacterales bacterium]